MKYIIHYPLLSQHRWVSIAESALLSELLLTKKIPDIRSNLDKEHCEDGVSHPISDREHNGQEHCGQEHCGQEYCGQEHCGQEYSEQGKKEYPRTISYDDTHLLTMSTDVRTQHISAIVIIPPRTYPWIILGDVWFYQFVLYIMFLNVKLCEKKKNRKSNRQGCSQTGFLYCLDAVLNHFTCVNNHNSSRYSIWFVNFRYDLTIRVPGNWWSEWHLKRVYWLEESNGPAPELYPPVCDFFIYHLGRKG